MLERLFEQVVVGVILAGGRVLVASLLPRYVAFVKVLVRIRLNQEKRLCRKKDRLPWAQVEDELGDFFEKYYPLMERPNRARIEHSFYFCLHSTGLIRDFISILIWEKIEEAWDAMRVARTGKK